MDLALNNQKGWYAIKLNQTKLNRNSYLKYINMYKSFVFRIQTWSYKGLLSLVTWNHITVGILFEFDRNT